jgi:hypothetical protein
VQTGRVNRAKDIKNHVSALRRDDGSRTLTAAHHRNYVKHYVSQPKASDPREAPITTPSAGQRPGRVFGGVPNPEHPVMLACLRLVGYWRQISGLAS